MFFVFIPIICRDSCHHDVINFNQKSFKNSNSLRSRLHETYLTYQVKQRRFAPFGAHFWETSWNNTDHYSFKLLTNSSSHELFVCLLSRNSSHSFWSHWIHACGVFVPDFYMFLRGIEYIVWTHAAGLICTSDSELICDVALIKIPPFLSQPTLFKCFSTKSRSKMTTFLFPALRCPDI